jgi:hypothetical protein
MCFSKQGMVWYGQSGRRNVVIGKYLPKTSTPESLFRWCRTVGPLWNSRPTPCPTNFSTTPNFR